MTAAEARAFTVEQNLTEIVAEIVADAPPLTDEAADTWRRARAAVVGNRRATRVAAQSK